MGLTTAPPRLRLAPPSVPASPAQTLLLPLLMGISLLGTAALTGPCFAQIPQVPRITPELLATCGDSSQRVRVSIRLFQSPGAEAATYAFVQMNAPERGTQSTYAVETAVTAEGQELQAVAGGTQAQERLLHRLLAVPGTSWQPLGERSFGVRPQSRAQVTIFAADGAVLAAGELTTFDRSGGVRAVLESLASRRCQLIWGDDAGGTLQTSVDAQDPADS